jgi:hypothetical protein
VNRRRGLSLLLAVVAAAAAGLALATCSVDRGQYLDRVYACDLRQIDQSQECGEGWVCHPGTQLGTFDFCAQSCQPGTDAGADFCSPDGALLASCDPQNPVCGPDLQCLRTSTTEDQGLCLPVEVCGRNDECRDPLRRSCLSKVLADAYGGGLDPARLNNLWCLQGDCNELSPCEAGHSCLGGLPLLQRMPPVCAPNCVRNPRDGGVDDFCPASFVCASKVLSSLPYRFCLPGLFGFPCENDDQCLIGKCLAMGSHTKACSVSCTTDAQCNEFYHPTDATKAGVRCIEGQCVTAFSLYMQLLCDPADNRCPDAAQCVDKAALLDAGVPAELAPADAFCYRPCQEAADCRNTGATTACLAGNGAGLCVPGVPWDYIQCDPSDPDACLKGLQCLPGPGARTYCTIPCDQDQQCQAHPWLGDAWRCPAVGANRVCTSTAP